MKLEADSRLGGSKDEARLLGKVSLDTWRFILGYIAKYHWILFQGSFLAPHTKALLGRFFLQSRGRRGRCLAYGNIGKKLTEDAAGASDFFLGEGRNTFQGIGDAQFLVFISAQSVIGKKLHTLHH